MKKETLVQFCKIKKEIKDIEGRIKRLEKQSSIVSDTVQSSNGFPYKQHFVGISGIHAKKFARLEEYHLMLMNFNSRLIELQIEIEEFIETIEDTELRQIFRLRIFDGFSWIKIMHIMDYNEESTARKKFERFLEKIA